jgi:PAS domain S-box-containing protein
VSELSELLESREFLRLVQEEASDGLILVDDRGVIVWANRAMAELRGVPLDQLTGRHFLEVSLPEEKEKYLEHFARAMQGAPVRLRTRAVLPSGVERHMDVHASTIEFRGRKFGLSVVRDVTDRVLAEAEARRAREDLERSVQARTAELRESEERFRSAFDHAATGMCLVSPTGHFLRVNSILCRMLGHEPEVLVTRTVLDLVHPEDRAVNAERLEQAVSGELAVIDLETRGLHRDGRVVWVNVTASLLRDGQGKPLYFVFQVLDVTSRKRAEQAIRQSEERFRAISEATPVGILISRVSDGTLLFVNEAAARGMSIPREQALGRKSVEFYGDPAERADLMERLRQGESIDGHEMLLRRKDGATLWASASLRLMTFQGEPAILGAYHDITARKEAEAAIRQSEERFRLIAEATPVAMAITRASDGTILYANERASRELGVPREGLLGGRSIGDFYADPADRPALREKLFRDGGVTDYEFKLRRADGSLGWGMTSLRVTTYRGEPAVLGAFIDLTPLKEAQEELRRAHDELERRIEERTSLLSRELAERRRIEEHLRLYREIFAHATEGILILDREGRFLEQNESHRRMLGYADEELRADPPNLRTEGGPRVLESLLEKGLFLGEVANRAKDGRLLHVELSAFPVRGASGEVLCTVAIKRDVTARKAAEDALRASEERWRSLVHSAPSVIMTVDRDESITSINRVVEGYRVEDVVGTPASSYLPPDSQPRFREALGRVFRDKAIVTYEVRTLNPDGSALWWACHAGPVTAGGEVVAAVVTATDITARKEGERRLAALAEEQSLLLAHSRDFVYRHDIRGMFTYMSPAVEQVTGYSIVEWMTHYTEYLTDNPINRKVIEYTEETLRTGKQSPPYLVEIFAKGGRRLLLEVNERAYHEEGRIAGIIGVARDVTDRVRSEEEIRFQKTLLESQAEASIDGILVVSTEGRMISFNRRFVEMWEIPSKVVESRSDDAALQSVLDKLADPGAFLARVRHLYDHPDEESRDEIALKDGRTFDRYSAPVRSRDGVLYGRVWYFRDVTGRKRTEVELRRAVEETRRAYEDLKEAQAQLIRTEKLASIGMLVSGVAHEINNPLNVMYGNLQLLEELAGAVSPLIRKSPGLPRGVRRFRAMVRDALKAARHARGVIEDFRGFARDVRTAEEVDLNRCLEEALTLVQPHLRPGVRVVRKFGALPPVRCLRGQVSQVFLNLLKNAAEAIEKPRGSITLRTRRRNGRAVVEVADTGRGMTEEVRKNLFEPFFTTKPVGRGLGLGLSISAMIVQNHGGKIAVSSRPGRGSVFRVELPIHA